jgi:hypothetical protein
MKSLSASFKGGLWYGRTPKVEIRFLISRRIYLESGNNPVWYDAALALIAGVPQESGGSAAADCDTANVRLFRDIWENERS